MIGGTTKNLCVIDEVEKDEFQLREEFDKRDFSVELKKDYKPELEEKATSMTMILVGGVSFVLVILFIVMFFMGGAAAAKAKRR